MAEVFSINEKFTVVLRILTLSMFLEKQGSYYCCCCCYCWSVAEKKTSNNGTNNEVELFRVSSSNLVPFLNFFVAAKFEEREHFETKLNEKKERKKN